MPRGLDNNNPGNIILTGTLYPGEITPSRDPRFKTFSHIQYGYRAMFRLIRAYILRGENTINKIVQTWAPEPEQWKRRAYIDAVVNDTGIPENRAINPDDWNSLAQIVAAMSRVENGVPANMQDVYGGMLLARSGTVPAAAAQNSSKISPGLIWGAVGAGLLILYLSTDGNN